MANPTGDPLGVVAERQRLIRYLDQLSSAIANYVGDANGRNDLQTKAAEVSFRLNSASSTENSEGTAFNQFGLEHGSTA